MAKSNVIKEWLEIKDEMIGSENPRTGKPNAGEKWSYYLFGERVWLCKNIHGKRYERRKRELITLSALSKQERDRLLEAFFDRSDVRQMPPISERKAG